MNYALVYFVKGAAKEAHEGLSREIAEKFNVACVVDKVPSRITLKYTGRSDSQSEFEALENFVETFCKEHKRSDFKIEGVGSFGNEVIYLNVLPSPEMRATYDDLYRELQQFTWMRMTPAHEGENMQFHLTLAAHDIKDRYDDIMAFAKEKAPSFEGTFDSIAIMKRTEDKQYIIHKEYPLAE